MLSLIKRWVDNNWIVRIVMLCILFTTFLNQSLAEKQNTDFLFTEKEDSLKTSFNHSKKEKELLRLTKTVDSLSEINKLEAYELIRKTQKEFQDKDLDKYLLADYLHVYGKLLTKNGKSQNGLDTLKLALKLKSQLYGQSDNRLAKTLNYIGIANFRMHNFEEALSNYNRAVNILITNNFYGRDLFDAYLNIGIIKASLGNFDKAYAYFEKASKVIDQNGKSDSLMLARFYNNYGLLSTLMGKMELANKNFDISEDYYIGMQGNQDLSLANLNINKGVNTFMNLNYTLSILYHKNAVDLYLDNNLKETGLIKALNNLCALYRELGDLELSLDYGLRALEISSSDKMKLFVYQNLIKTYDLLGNYDKAVDNFNLALSIIQQPNYNPMRKFDLYILYAEFLFKNKDFDKSFFYYKLALDIEGKSNGYKTQKYALVLSKIGYYYLAVEANTDKSLHYFNRSIEIWKTHIHLDNNVVSESFHDLRFVFAYRGKSKALVKKYNGSGNMQYLFESLKNYEWLLEQLERISRNLQKENQEIIREQLYPIYNEAIELSFKLYDLTTSDYYQKKAFSFSEKSKSAMLLSSIQNMNALKTSDLPKSLLELDQNLNEEINAINKQLFEEKQKIKINKVKMSFFENRLVTLLQKHDSLVLELEQNHKKYYALKYDLSIIDFDDLNRKLSNKEALIEYQLFDSVLYIFTLRNKKLFTKRLIVDSLFYESLTYITQLKNADLCIQTRNDFNEFTKHSINLYNYLIDPVRKLINDKNLIIIPSGLLGYLPFELLVKPGGIVKELDYKNLNYLIKEFPISYAYSSTLRFSPYFNNPAYKTNLSILYMSPEYNSDSEDEGGFVLSDLPFAKIEVDELQSEFGGKVLSGKSALKSSFIKSAPSYDILHLAMHTIINDSLPMYSKLVFSDDGLNIGTKYLHTSDIYSLNLKASMVTLSACNTGNGILKKGEGIMSLARGFVFAGVPSVVMTLWEVQDESGLSVMKAFYSYLSKGLPKDQAMQMAKLDVLSSANMIKSHPNFWSAYIVTGDTAAINIEDERNNLWQLLFFVFPLIFIFIFYKKSVGNVKY